MAGELAGDGDRDDRAALAAPFERVPALVQATRALIGACADGGRLAAATALERRAFPEWTPLVAGVWGAFIRFSGLGSPTRG